MSIQIPTAGKGVIKPGEFIFELFASAKIDAQNVEYIQQALEIVTTIISGSFFNAFFFFSPFFIYLPYELDELGSGSMYHIEQFATALSLVFSEMDPSVISQHYKVFLDEYSSDRNSFARGKSEKIRTLNFWCFNSGVAMKPLNSSGIRSFILTSGTLSPLDSFAYELQT